MQLKITLVVILINLRIMYLFMQVRNITAFAFTLSFFVCMYWTLWSALEDGKECGDMATTYMTLCIGSIAYIHLWLIPCMCHINIACKQSLVTLFMFFVLSADRIIYYIIAGVVGGIILVVIVIVIVVLAAVCRKRILKERRNLGKTNWSEAECVIYVSPACSYQHLWPTTRDCKDN